MQPVKVLLVDDSALMRALLKDILSHDSVINVIGTAVDGEDAVAKVKTLRPDAVVLDIVMPKLDGLGALRRIMKEHPTQIVMFSGVNDSDKVYEALSEGAFDFVAKPDSPSSKNIEEIRKQLVPRVIAAAKTDIGKRKLRAEAKQAAKPSSPVPSKELEAPLKKIIAVGASTGGPPALEYIIDQLPNEIEAAMLIVQHLPRGFTEGLVKRINRKSAIEVKRAIKGEKITSRKVLIAPSEYHMRVIMKDGRNEGRIELGKKRKLHGVRPSIDVLMESVAAAYRKKAIGLLLTGLGKDGALGMQAIKKAKGTTIAQDENTSTAFYMPQSAIKRGCVDKVVALEKIASEIEKLVKS